jgi:cell division protein FtsL
MTYSSALSISRQQRFTARSKNAVDFRASRGGVRLGPVSNTVMLIILACLLGLLYLTQVTKTNAYGYQLDALNKQQQQLQDEHANLELASANMQSVDRVKDSPQATAMAPVAPSGTVQN